MSDEGPKLYVNKPKKAQLKKHLQQPRPSSSPSPLSSSSSMASQSSTAASSSPNIPSPPPKDSFARRYKFIGPLIVAVSLFTGAYLFIRTKKKEKVEGEVPATTSTGITTASVVDIPTAPHATVESVKLREPIPVDQQLELFKWILEEKRKVKPRDAEEKKRIDEEKAILKQFIRSKSIPSL